MCGESWNGRWLTNHSHACIQLGELRVEPVGNGKGAVLLAGALIKGLQAHHDRPLIGTGSIESIATDHSRRKNVVLFLEDPCNLLTHLLGLAERSAVLKLIDAQDVALVFVWNKGLR